MRWLCRLGDRDLVVRGLAGRSCRHNAGGGPAELGAGSEVLEERE